MAESKAKAEVKEVLNIFQAIPRIMEDMSAIGKNKKNQQQGFLYRGIDDLYNELHPVLAKYGVFTVPEVLEDRTEDRQTKSGGTLIYRILKMKYTFYASDGTSFEAVVMGEGMDSGDKACNKAMSIAHKYAFFQVFAVATEELIDPDAVTHPESKKKGGSNEKGQSPTPVQQVASNPPAGGNAGNNAPSGSNSKSAPAKNKAAENPANSKAEDGVQGLPGLGDGGRDGGSGFPDFDPANVDSMFKAAVAVANHPADYKINPKHIPLIMQPAIAIKGTKDVEAMKYYIGDLKAYVDETEEVRNEKIQHLGVIQ